MRFIKRHGGTLVWLVPCILILIRLLYISYRSIAVTMELSGVGAISSVAALLLAILLAMGVYSMRDALESVTGSRTRTIWRLVLTFVAATVVWVDLFGRARGGEAAPGVLAAMFLCGFVAQFSVLTLLLFASRGFVDRYHGVEAKAKLNARGAS